MLNLINTKWPCFQWDSQTRLNTRPWQIVLTFCWHSASHFYLLLRKTCTWCFYRIDSDFVQKTFFTRISQETTNTFPKTNIFHTTFSCQKAVLKLFLDSCSKHFYFLLATLLDTLASHSWWSKCTDVNESFMTWLHPPVSINNPLHGYLPLLVPFCFAPDIVWESNCERPWHAQKFRGCVVINY